MNYQSELYAKEYAAADQRVVKAAAMPMGSEKEAKLRKEALMEAEATRKRWWGELCSLANKYRRLNNDNVVIRDGHDDVVLGRNACLANQEALRFEMQASGNRLAAKVRRGEQLDARKLHQPQPPEADSAAAQRAQDPEDDKGLRVTLVPRRAAPGAADDKGSGATLELSS